MSRTCPFPSSSARSRPLRSLEFFPPKDEAGVAALRQTAAALKRISPDFVSMTYGAGGSTRWRSARSALFLREEFGFTVMPHLTCVGHSRAELDGLADRIHAGGLPERHDAPRRPAEGPRGIPAGARGLRHADELVALLKARHPDFCLGVAGYPEKHPEAPSPEADLGHLRRKVDAGAAFITTQLFFDNDVYYRFVDRCRAAGIAVPIVPGILPVLSLAQVQRFSELCGATLPDKLRRRLEAAGDHAEAAEAVGIDWALAQIRDLVERGAPGGPTSTS